jgi:hypothetical protein
MARQAYVHWIPGFPGEGRRESLPHSRPCQERKSASSSARPRRLLSMPGALPTDQPALLLSPASAAVAAGHPRFSVPCNATVRPRDPARRFAAGACGKCAQHNAERPAIRGEPQIQTSGAMPSQGRLSDPLPLSITPTSFNATRRPRLGQPPCRGALPLARPDAAVSSRVRIVRIERRRLIDPRGVRTRPRACLLGLRGVARHRRAAQRVQATTTTTDARRVGVRPAMRHRCASCAREVLISAELRGARPPETRRASGSCCGTYCVPRRFAPRRSRCASAAHR